VLSQVCRYPAPAVAVIRSVFTFSVCLWGQQQCEGSINQHHAIILPQYTGHAPAIYTLPSPLSPTLSFSLRRSLHSLHNLPFFCNLSSAQRHQINCTSLLPEPSVLFLLVTSDLQLYVKMRFTAALAALAAATAVAAPTLEVRALKDDSAAHQDDPAFVSAVMRAHWYWRKLHCAQELTWDPELANQARADLEKCPDRPVHVRRHPPSHSLHRTCSLKFT
jgi:hypothetical protein